MAPLSIYDPEESERSHYVVLPDKGNDLHPFVQQTRLLLVGAVNYAQGYVSKAKHKYQRSQQIYNSFMSHVPEEEKNALGLLVVAVAGMTGSLTYPHRPILRRLVVTPGLMAGGAAFCFPQTCKHIARTGLAHSGSSFDIDAAIDRPFQQLPSPGQVASGIKTRAQELRDILTTLDTGKPGQEASAPKVDPSDPEVEQAVADLSKKPQPTQEDSAQAPKKEAAEEGAPGADAANKEERPQGKEQRSADKAVSDEPTAGKEQDVTDDTVLVVKDSKSGAMTEDVVEKDFGQANKDDLDTYTSRR